MPYDPQWPQDGQLIDATLFRNQFSGIKDLIDAAAGLTGVVVDAVNTVNPGDPATVNLGIVGSTLHFSFGIPRGSDGAAGPVFGNTIVDGVTTLNPSDAAVVQTSFDGSNERFQFGIPRGNDGSNGQNGSDGTSVTGAIMDGANVRFTFGIPRGQDGASPTPITSFIVDGVNMLNPTDPASVQSVFDGNAVRMIFNLPRGFTGNDGAAGTPGSNGSNGNDGGTGPQGPQGPPFANALVDSVTTLNPGDNATVQTSFDGSNVRFQFGIPRGQNGNDGGSGPQGLPGEVTMAQLSTAIKGTSNNSNGVNTLDTPFANDPPTLADLELMRVKLNELITTLRR